MDIQRFKKLPIMGIVRGVEEEQLAPLIQTVIASGLETLEITMNTQNAPLLIKQAVKLSGGKLCVGAGTVLNVQDLKSALQAGATFMVSPVLIPKVAQYCRKNKIPFFPGALTPTEIYQAWESGATMVKVFPAKFFGPEYFKEIKAPFQDIQLLACSGVTPENICAYFNSGASAVSFGASVFRKEWLKAGDFKSIGSAIKAYISQFE